jgi:spore germination protein KB
MGKEMISNKQGIFITSMFILGSAIVVSTGAEAKQDVWIAILMALLLSIPMLFIYSKLLTLYPGKDLYDILIEVFGNITGKIISSVFVWYSFHLGALVIRNFSEFVNVISFPETPQYVIVVFLGLLCIWIVKSGLEVLGRWSAFVFPILVVILLVTIALTLQNAHLINLKPILYKGMKPVLATSISLFTFPFAETVVLTLVFNSLKNHNKTFKVLLIGVLVGCLAMLIISVRNILVLGPEATSHLYFPSYLAVRTANIGNFLQRFEVTVAIVFICSGFIKASICLYAAVKGAAKILNIENYTYIVAPIAFLMMNLACTIYNSTMEMFEWAIKINPYYAIPFQVLLPIIILIAAKIKIKVKSKNQKAPA